MALSFLNKYKVKAIYSNAPEMNLIGQDLGIGMIRVTFNKKSVTRIDTATGTAASAEILIGVSISIDILKTKPADSIYKDKFKRNGVIEGTLLLIDDVGEEWQFQDLSMNLESFNSDGTEAHRPYIIDANMVVNEDLVNSL